MRAVDVGEATVTEKSTLERRTMWRFEIENENWSWVRTRPDGSEDRSSRAFDSLQECGRDAMQHGYAVWKSAERRKVEPGRDALEVALG